MAPPRRLSGVASREPPSVTSSRHATHFRWLCHQLSLASPSEWSAAYVTSLHSPQQWETARSSTCYHTSRCFAWSVHHSRRSRGLPVAPPRAALVAPPSWLSSTRTSTCCGQTAGAPAPLSPPPHVARGVVEFMSQVFSREATPSTGITSSGLSPRSEN